MSASQQEVMPSYLYILFISLDKQIPLWQRQIQNCWSVFRSILSDFYLHSRRLYSEPSLIYTTSFNSELNGVLYNMEGAMTPGD